MIMQVIYILSICLSVINYQMKRQASRQNQRKSKQPQRFCQQQSKNDLPFKRRIKLSRNKHNRNINNQIQASPDRDVNLQRYKVEPEEKQQQARDRDNKDSTNMNDTSNINNERTSMNFNPKQELKARIIKALLSNSDTIQQQIDYKKSLSIFLTPVKNKTIKYYLNKTVKKQNIKNRISNNHLTGNLNRGMNQQISHANKYHSCDRMFSRANSRSGKSNGAVQRNYTYLDNKMDNADYFLPISSNNIQINDNINVYAEKRNSARFNQSLEITKIGQHRKESQIREDGNRLGSHSVHFRRSRSQRADRKNRCFTAKITDVLKKNSRDSKSKVFWAQKEALQIRPWAASQNFNYSYNQKQFQYM